MSGPTHFSIVKFIPDPIANESVNIGVVAVSGETCRVQFLKDWRRASALKPGSSAYLRQIANELANVQGNLFGQREGKWNLEMLRECAGHWRNVIQFETPKASLKEIDDLFPDLIHLYLKETNRKAQAPSRRTAASSVYAAVELQLEKTHGEGALGLLKRDYELVGKIESHSYDVAIANGTPYGAALGLSFASGSTTSVRREVDALAFSVEDVRSTHRRLPLAVVYVSDHRPDEVSRAARIFGKLGASFIEHKEITNWANVAANAVPKAALAHA